VEEPIRADRPLRDWAAVSRAFTAPTAAGENIYGTAAFDAFRDLGGLRILQPDIAKWGGLSGARQVMETAGAANGKSAALWPHFMGSAVGQWASLVVSALAGPESRCEFDVNANPLRSELTAEPFAVRDGRIAWPDRAGLVPEPAGEALGRFRADRGD
ncbi:enolase C-terminal domain-like protein, partial [Pelagibius sp.]|uniref:enolase C-terminal domain-like protein n=1 Tax=Pelagibius sp. TaxID=1931238 RepID=UPI00260719A6